MAKSRKRRARSALAKYPSPDTINGTPVSDSKRNPRAVADLPPSLYRTLKIAQMLMQATEQFLWQFSPFMPDETGIAARKLHGDVTRELPIVNDVLARCEQGSNGTAAGSPWEGGDK